MKKFTFLLLTLAILMFGLTTVAFAGPQDFVAVNNTGVDIYHLYVSPSAQNNWGDDILGKDVLLAGDSNDILFDKAETSALWDIKIADKDGNGFEWTGLNLLTITKITLNYDGTVATATCEYLPTAQPVAPAPTAARQDFVAVNNTGVDIYHLYVSPSAQDTWGDDILGKDVLLAGDSNDILFDKSATSALWDIKILDKDGNGYMWTGINLFTTSKITLNYDGTNATATCE